MAINWKLIGNVIGVATMVLGAVDGIAKGKTQNDAIKKEAEKAVAEAMKKYMENK